MENRYFGWHLNTAGKLLCTGVDNHIKIIYKKANNNNNKKERKHIWNVQVNLIEIFITIGCQMSEGVPI